MDPFVFYSCCPRDDDDSCHCFDNDNDDNGNGDNGNGDNGNVDKLQL